ncbi:MAG TPA: hypothetical protein PLL30_17190 [Candidatus Krumholzibacteria bacterium]|nr:hypothetical protein [Candidatus Krumholzibacteria bacterium]HRY42233.1 hypothetical protein [Candidatus Krumholzibacteria bacterium]
MSATRINLVRVDTIASSEGIDVESGGNTYTQHDEVELVNGDGAPAVATLNAGWIDQDIRYEYTSGALGYAKRRRRHTIEIPCDYLTNATRTKLERWMHDRALIRFNPGYGRHTDFAWRPLTGEGTTYPDGATTLKDLTGRWDITTVGDPSNNYVWHKTDYTMLGDFAGTNPRRVIWTEAGAGLVCEAAKTNRFVPGYPLAATEGNSPSGGGSCGWTKAGTNSADITIAYDADGFGHDDIPGAINVSTTYEANRLRYLEARTLWEFGDANYQGYEFTGTGTVRLSIWLKGRFSEAATLVLGQTGASVTTLSLADIDFTQWRKVSLSLTATWARGSQPYVWLLLTTGSGAANASNFSIGPCSVVLSNQHDHEWSAHSTAATASYCTVADYLFPRAGSMICSVYYPSEASLGTTPGNYMFGTAVSGKMGYSSATGCRWYRTADAYLGGTSNIAQGAVNTLAAVWGNGYDYRLYSNGVLIDSAAANETEITVGAEASALILGGYTTSTFFAWPLLPLTWRIDRRVWTPAEVEGLDAALRDPVCNAVSVAARGREYQIKAVPSTPRNQIGGTAWLGIVVLEEYKYETNLTDITSEEQ